MNITYFSHYFAPEIGAPSARIYDLGGQWIKQGHEVGVVTCLPNHPTGRLYSGYEPRWRMRETLNGISVYRHWTYITPNKGFVKKTLGHLSYLAGSRVFSEPKIATTDVGIGTSPTFFAAMSAAAFCRRRRIPFIMEVRDLWPAIFVELGVLRNRRVIRLLERWEMGLYRQASRIVVVTESFRRKLIERGISAHKLVTIPNGADIEFWSPGEDSHRLRQELNLKDRFIVLYIGAHGISHALDRILDTAAELQKHPQIHFLFVGEGAEKEGLEQRAKELKLTNITFRGSVSKDEVKEYYGIADVCLVPLKDIPLFEAFIPSKMFEMMAMAQPILGSLRGEAADILRQSGAAKIVEPENSAALADAILDLYQSAPAIRREMGQRGRDFAIEHYSRATLAARYLQVLSEAIEDYGQR